MVGATDGVEQFGSGDRLDQSSGVQAVVDMFGSGDLARWRRTSTRRHRNSSAARTTACVVRVRPGERHDVRGRPGRRGQGESGRVRQPLDTPFLFFHGTDDHLISPSQTLTLHNALRAAGIDSTRYVLEGVRHGDLAFLGDPQSGLAWTSREVMGYLIDFLNDHLTG